jgi:transcriptional regulator with XRE-family HTH domain
MLNEVAKTLREKYTLGIVTIYLYDNKKQELYLAGGSGINTELIGKCRYKVGPKKKDQDPGATPWVFNNLRAIRTDNIIGYCDPITNERIHKGRWMLEYYGGNGTYEGFYGSVRKDHQTDEKVKIPFLGLPVFIGDEKLGVIKAEFKIREGNLTYFTSVDEDLFWAISNILALPIKLSQTSDVREEPGDIDYEKRLGERIKVLRNQLGKTQKEMAEEIGNVDNSYISRLEKWKLSPSLKRLAKISKALNITPSELLSDRFAKIKEKTIMKSHPDAETLIESLDLEDPIKSFEVFTSVLRKMKDKQKKSS